MDTVDDGSTVCPADPDAGDNGQYCNPDDDDNDTDIFERQATSTSNTELVRDGRGWGISDNNSIENTKRPFTISPTFANMFVDPLFQDTHVKTVRRVIPWDIVARASVSRTTPMNSTPTKYPNCRNGQRVTEKLAMGMPVGPDLPGNADTDVNGDGRLEGSEKSDLKIFDEWYKAVPQSLNVMVSFEHSRPEGAWCYLPTRPQYRAAVKAFRDLYPGIRLYTSWNEPNHRTQPTSARFDAKTGTRPEGLGFRQAGRFWTDLKRECQSVRATPVGTTVRCTVGAGEFLDTPDMSDKPYNARTRGGLAFKNYLEGLNKQEPSVWAWHAYSAGYAGLTDKRNRRTGARITQTRSVKRLARYIDATDYFSKDDPRIWLTEQGGRYDLHVNPTYGNEASATALASADADLGYLLDLPFHPSTKNRITRFLVYGWVGEAPRAPSTLSTFDSGLLDVFDSNRPARAMYNTFKAKASTAP